MSADEQSSLDHKTFYRRWLYGCLIQDKTYIVGDSYDAKFKTNPLSYVTP